MIFVTLGTHEQPFDRLVMEIDRLVIKGIIKEDVFIQIGFSYKYTPKCSYEKIVSFQQMDELINKTHIIITHGGPGSIFLALSHGKVPIVVPRQRKFGEHVDDHQVLFTKKLENEKKVIAVYDIRELGEKISNYHKYLYKLGIKSGNKYGITKKAKLFSEKIDKICKNLMEI